MANQTERDEMSNDSRLGALLAEHLEEQRRKERGLMSDSFRQSLKSDAFNEACGRDPFPTLHLGPAPKMDVLTGKTIPSEPYKTEPRIGSERTRVSDPVNKPAHYTGHKSGVECITITEHMGFNLGNALKYIWRCDLKADALEDLRKAEFYIKREIAKREKAAA